MTTEEKEDIIAAIATIDACIFMFGENPALSYKRKELLKKLKELKNEQN